MSPRRPSGWPTSPRCRPRLERDRFPDPTRGAIKADPDAPLMTTEPAVWGVTAPVAMPSHLVLTPRLIPAWRVCEAMPPTVRPTVDIVNAPLLVRVSCLHPAPAAHSHRWAVRLTAEPHPTHAHRLPLDRRNTDNLRLSP